MASDELCVPVTVQFDEVDSYRIVHHSRLVAYLERARLPFLLGRGFDADPERVVAVVHAMGLAFRKPARLRESLEVRCRLLAVEPTRLVLDERITRGKDLIMKSRTELAFVDPRDGLPLPAEAVFR